MKELILESDHIRFFWTKGLNYDFGPKLEITPWFGFEQSKRENNVWLLSI